MPAPVPSLHPLTDAAAVLAAARDLIGAAAGRVLVHGHAGALAELRAPLRAASRRGCGVRVLAHEPVSGCGGEFTLVAGDPGPAGAFWLQVAVDGAGWLAADAAGGAGPLGAWGRHPELAAALARVLDTLHEAGGLRAEMAGAAGAAAPFVRRRP